MHQVYELSDLVERRRRTDRPWMEFLRAGSLSMGLYVLPPGATDRQSPHTEDEVYHVISGRGILQVAGEDRSVGPGSVIFVPARSAHHFHGIKEELTALVFFSPAEGTGTAGTD